MKLSTHATFYLFVCAMFLAISGSNLFSDGMFMDGTLYADISRNMAEGLGSFWAPHLTHTFFPEFYEHPPLALGLQSLWFSLWGDSIYVERFYALFTYSVTGILLVMIWAKLTGEAKTGWLPLLLWLVVPDVAWAVANNMLENTMTVFVCLSVFFYLKNFDKNQLFWVTLAGLSLSFGVLSKGFFCLYIWGLPFFHWWFIRDMTFGKMLQHTALIIFATCLPIVLLFTFSPEANHNMSFYFKKQVLGSIESVKTVETRFAIILKLLENIAVPILLVVIIGVIGFRRKVKALMLNQNSKITWVFMAVVLSGVLPIMISMKQRGFYILTVYPLFAIGMAYLVYPILQYAWAQLKRESKGFYWFQLATLALCALALTICIRQVGNIGRDKEMVMDTKAIIQKVGNSTTIGICTELHKNWSLQGYFSRYGNVSLDKDTSKTYMYFVCEEGGKKHGLKEQYEAVTINTKMYSLYKIRDKR